jgi:hypothetical protein
MITNVLTKNERAALFYHRVGDGDIFVYMTQLHTTKELNTALSMNPIGNITYYIGYTNQLDTDADCAIWTIKGYGLMDISIECNNELYKSQFPKFHRQ